MKNYESLLMGVGLGVFAYIFWNSILPALRTAINQPRGLPQPTPTKAQLRTLFLQRYRFDAPLYWNQEQLNRAVYLPTEQMMVLFAHRLTPTQLGVITATQRAIEQITPESHKCRKASSS